ncbi:MAG TPA: hypothetical protein VF087_14290, partial [Solirubrobacteraceae bacterium]
SVLLMHSTPGKCWSVSEIAGMLHDVGFADIGSRPAAADRPAIRARKPTGALGSHGARCV